MNSNHTKISTVQLEALKNALETQMEKGQVLGVERGYAYECGYYLGAIKAACAELESLIKSNK